MLWQCYGNSSLRNVMFSVESNVMVSVEVIYYKVMVTVEAMLWQFFSSLWIVTSLGKSQCSGNFSLHCGLSLHLENPNIMVYFKPFELNTTKLLLT